MSMTTAQKWEWSHLVEPRPGRRRQREFITVELNPDGWTKGTDPYVYSEFCNSMTVGWINGEPVGGTLSSEEWRQFHGRENSSSMSAVPTIWKVTHGPKSHRRRAFYCDVHLPDEFRPDRQGVIA